MWKSNICVWALAFILLLPGLAGAAPPPLPAAPDAALRAAILNDDLAAVETAIAAGANVNLVREDYTDNPLALAVGRNNLPAARLLLQKGANPNLHVAGNGFVNSTPLLSAISLQDVSMVKLLIEMGADVNLPSHKYHKPAERELSPLMMAIIAPSTKDSMDIFALILSAGADVDYATSDGYTVLMVAAHGEYNRYKKEEVYVMTENLLKRGAKLYPRNQRGETAIDIALLRDFDELAALFNQDRFKQQRSA